jgi:hypothetical protein
MIAAAIGFVRDTSQMPLIKTTNVVGVDRALVPLGSPCLGNGSPIHGCYMAQSFFVVVKDVCLRSADNRVDRWRPVRSIPGKEFSYEPAAAEGTEKPAPFRFKP